MLNHASSILTPRQAGKAARHVYEAGNDGGRKIEVFTRGDKERARRIAARRLGVSVEAVLVRYVRTVHRGRA
jgi:hypothetical protein